MKKILLEIIEAYLTIFPDEKDRQKQFINFLNKSSDEEIIDWNNFDGHLVSGGFVYAKDDKKFLVLYHKDLKMFLYPGGHISSYDKNPLETALREIKEETGINNLIELKVANNALIPIDIDTQKIRYNERLKLPAHYHFDFRYLFMIDKISDVKIDTEELSEYKWIDAAELSKNKNYGWLTEKINKIIMTSDNNIHLK